MSEPFFSVIIPTYNRAHMIGATIESVLNQTFKGFELIIVDDGSTDNTKKVINQYLLDPRVKYIYQENKERAAARNNGIRNSSGKWIALIDSDDIWMPDHLEVGYEAIKNIKELSLVYSNYYLINEIGEVTGKQKNSILKGLVLDKIVIQGHAGFCNSSSFIHREILNDVGLFNESLFAAEDTELWIRIASKYPFYPTNRYTVKLRKHKQQTMGDPEHMETWGKKMYDIIFSNPNLKIEQFMHIALANGYILFAISYYSSGRMREARQRLFKAVQNDKKILLKRSWWTTYFKTILSKRIILLLRDIKRRISTRRTRQSKTFNNSSKIGVCMIVSKYPPHLGGLEKQAHLLSKSLVAHGFNVFVITRNYNHIKKDEIIDGIHVHRVGLLGISRWLASLSYITGSLLWLFKNRKKYHIVHCHQSYSPMTIGAITKLILKKPVIVKLSTSDRLSDFVELKKLPFNRIRQYLLKKVNMFIALNTIIRKEAILHFIPENRIMVIPNGTEIPKQYSYKIEDKMTAKEKLNLNKSEKIAIFLGRISSEKALDVLIKAWEKVMYNLKVNLLIVGEDSSVRNVGHDIRQLVINMHLEGSVIFTGKVNNPFDYLIASDLFIIPSRTEGMSNSLLEAMSAGCAIIASDIKPNMELIKDNVNGILFKTDDYNDLANKISLLLSDQQLETRLGKSARQVIETNYSIAAIADKYIYLYNKLLTR